MHRVLNQATSHEPSAERLAAIYAKGLIPPEKKPFLIDLRASSGPYLAVAEGGGLICDGASQIASVGLGFNAGASFGAAEYLESWTNQTSTPTYAALRTAYERLLQRQLGSADYAAHFCASGAEANETVLGYLFQNRRRPEARRVLAFEGSFHGRMMVSLASTWNPAKREPFTWPGHESIFAPYPVMEGDDVHAPREPDGWNTLWTVTDDAGFESALAAMRGAGGDDDELLKAEIESLRAVRDAILGGETLAILIEPMQCEGGDRYSSRRFHQGLALLSHAFETPLVYDEIQTGFGLGAEFFWHRKFCLQKPDGSEFFPAGVVCAKKAQAGVALVHMPAGPLVAGAAAPVEQTSAASVARGYIQASVIEQFHDAIVDVEQENRERLARLCERHAGKATRPRVQGLSFAFDLDSGDEVGKFVAQRFQHGLLYYPAGAKTARFRMNLGFTPADRELFWSQLEEALDASFAGEEPPASEPIDPQARSAGGYYRFHERLIATKLDVMRGGAPPDRQEAVRLLETHLGEALPSKDCEVVSLDRDNYGDYRDRILAMQAKVYEPARQSPPEEFDTVFESDNPLAILVLSGEEIVAMAFAGPLAEYEQMRGVLADPHREDPRVYYSVDLTIAEGYRGGLGRAMKQAMTLLALSSGVTALHGRNRDRLAAGMWAINLSLGAHTTQRLRDDYPDQGPHRDCLYYRCETAWPEPPVDLGAGIEAPLGPAHLDREFVQRNLPVLVNKLTLSNFVTDDFLTHLEGVSQAFPDSLRRFYTASGLSEAVDKIVKVLWRHRQPRTGLLTIEGADFGSGSFMARSLSGSGEAYFPTERLPVPEGEGDEAFFDRLEGRLDSDELLGVFVEPLMRRTMTPLPPDALRRIVKSCRERGVPVVFNDTASFFYRYTADAFGASGVEGAEPDAVVGYLGGQTALVGASEAFFLADPLLLISTWDGDALSLAQFHRAWELVEADKAAFEETVAGFHDRVTAAVGGAETRLTRGVGEIVGSVPEDIAALLRSTGEGRWVSCPSYSEMLRYLAKPQAADSQ